MKDNMDDCDKYQDLIEFESKYINEINKFLDTDPETRIAFLNADFGWGKTKFIRDILGVKNNCIYSPWLNKSNNYLEEIYYNVMKKNKGKTSSRLLFLTMILAILSTSSSSLILILMEMNKDNLNCLLFAIVSIILIIFIILAIIIFIKPVPLISFSKEENGKYYEEKIIKSILKKIGNVLVIEDIDRVDNIESVLIAINKISDQMKVSNNNKYILITGDCVRTVRRISEPNSYDNYNYNLATYRDKGTLLLEKIVSLRIDFLTINERMDNIFNEYNLSLNLKKIERDEIIAFIKNRFLSIRFFIRFLEKYKDSIDKGISLYHLLLNYYQEEKYFNIDDEVINNSLYNISKFPICLNDIEMLLQCKKIKLPESEITKLSKRSSIDGNYDIIVNVFYDFLSENKNFVSIFKEFYTGDIYPRLVTDKLIVSDNTIIIGQKLKPVDLKRDLDNFLIGYNNNEIGMMENVLVNKRCYFSSKNSSQNYEIYKINSVNYDKTIEEDNNSFIIAYIACFLRNNRIEIKKNYPKINEKIEKIITK